MYLDHFGLNEPPFRITPHTDFFFAGANRGATLEALLYAITNDEGIVKVSGEVGSGKTMLCRVLMERLPKNVATIYLANPSLSRDEILFEIAEELELETLAERPSRLMRALQERLIGLYSAGRRVVVLIDEAHAMPRETLEEIRLLSNLETNRHKLLQIVLFGQPELEEHLDSADMRQLKERITHTFRLEPLVRSDIESYIDFRMRAAGYRGPNVFSAGALRLIARASEGLTRRVNILADKSLLAAFAGNTHAVKEPEVRRAIRDSDFHRFRPGSRALWVAAGGVAAGLLIGLGLTFVLPRSDSTPAASRVPSPAATAKEPAAAPPTSGSGATAGEIQAPAVLGSAPGNALASAAEVSPPKAEPELRPAPETGGKGPAEMERHGIVAERFAATQSWLDTSPGNHYSIQFMAVRASELARLERFLAGASKRLSREEFRVYGVKIDGVQHYRAAYGLYPGVAQAAAAIRELPPELKVHHPFHRSVERMRSQNIQ
ncbi:MAG: AAA family ATPase [Betaproteobacteria bacterium]|nr:AAA family ATPase [Betaproteobacteria bacterium]